MREKQKRVSQLTQRNLILYDTWSGDLSSGLLVAQTSQTNTVKIWNPSKMTLYTSCTWLLTILQQSLNYSLIIEK
jgi:hypothetical protein